jgi:hypothetical protein
MKSVRDARAQLHTGQQYIRNYVSRTNVAIMALTAATPMARTATTPTVASTARPKVLLLATRPSTVDELGWQSFPRWFVRLSRFHSRCCAGVNAGKQCLRSQYFWLRY